MKSFEFKITNDLSWQEDAQCSKPDAPYMFPSAQDDEGVRQAKETCRWCPVREQCLSGAMERGEQYGVWGGLTPEERRQLQDWLEKSRPLR